MTNKEYNGWYNYETWAVSLWMDNEQGSSDYWRERAQELLKDEFETALRDEPDHTKAMEEAVPNATTTLEDEIKGSYEESQPALEGFWADLLNAAMSEVNWREIAAHRINDAKDEFDYSEYTTETETE